MLSSSTFPLHLLLLLFISFSILSTNQEADDTTQSNMNPHELETLYKIMDSLSSDQDWRVSYLSPCQPGSGWPGIECKYSTLDNLFHVTRLDFGTPPNPACKNTATFPQEIFHLPNLDSIFIFQCFTRAPARILFPSNKIPTSPLQQLSLRSNSALMGTIPPQISTLRSLQILTLSQNRLTGAIPVEIFASTSLLHLDLSYNMLSGTIPLEIGNLGKLVGLDFSYNKLTGPISSAIGELRILQKLDLSSNQLTGTIPNSIHQLQSLVFLALSNNRLHGAFPKGLISLHSLQYFLMDNNPMFVSLPEEFGQLKKLQELRLSNSGYTGTIPSAYSQLLNLSSLSLQNNRLSGPIPEGFTNLSHIYHLNLSRNFLEGVVPFNSTFLRRLGRNLDMSSNPGLCLNQSDADGVNVSVGVDVCGNNRMSKQPVKKSEAAVLHCSNVFIISIIIISVGFVILSFHETVYCCS